MKSSSFLRSDPVTPTGARPSEQHMDVLKNTLDVSGHAVPKLALAQTGNCL